MSRLHDALNQTKPRMILPSRRSVQRTTQELPIGAPRGGSAAPAATPLKKIESPVGLLTALMGFYILLYMAPAVEIMAYYLHVLFPIIIIVGAIIVTAFPFTGQMSRFLRSPIAKPWLALMACYLAASAFSSYRGGSVPFMLGYCTRVHTMPFLFCGIALTARRVRHLMLWSAAACLLVLVICLKYGQYTEGRFALSQTSLENPNDLAFNLLLGCAFLLMFVFQRSWTFRILWAVTFPLSLLFVLKSGSRANFITLIAATVLAWLLSSSGVKVFFFLLAPVLMVIIAMLVPQSTWYRLGSIVADPRSTLASTDDPTVKSVVGSQLARTELQKRAWKMTLAHPLLGVGPMQFADYADSMVRTEMGRKSSWQYPHNVYLQISSECGIPALIFYVWSIVLCCRMNYRSFKLCGGTADRRSSRAQSYCLLLASVIYAIGIAFCNVAYYSYLSILVGFTAANSLAVQQELAITQKAA
jgi:O-antigen ligase